MLERLLGTELLNNSGVGRMDRGAIGSALAPGMPATALASLRCALSESLWAELSAVIANTTTTAKNKLGAFLLISTCTPRALSSTLQTEKYPGLPEL
jgi:hypothetical protein